jgi:hypothetical protein
MKKFLIITLVAAALVLAAQQQQPDADSVSDMAIAAAVTRRLAQYGETVAKLQAQLAREHARAEAAEAKNTTCQGASKGK